MLGTSMHFTNSQVLPGLLTEVVGGGIYAPGLVDDADLLAARVRTLDGSAPGPVLPMLASCMMPDPAGNEEDDRLRPLCGDHRTLAMLSGNFLSIIQDANDQMRMEIRRIGQRKTSAWMRTGAGRD